mmetsp:Transcript_21464/g.62539  ORF Transcript_21464/g.62539 Transcript_21464/m.62539 type:complete len:245 (-) Transcript_21464:829-1563(-)
MLEVTLKSPKRRTVAPAFSISDSVRFVDYPLVFPLEARGEAHVRELRRGKFSLAVGVGQSLPGPEMGTPTHCKWPVALILKHFTLDHVVASLELGWNHKGLHLLEYGLPRRRLIGPLGKKLVSAVRGNKAESASNVHRRKLAPNGRNGACSLRCRRKARVEKVDHAQWVIHVFRNPCVAEGTSKLTKDEEAPGKVLARWVAFDHVAPQRDRHGVHLGHLDVRLVRQKGFHRELKGPSDLKLRLQ